MRKWFFGAGTICWLFCIFLGLKTLWNYGLSAGEAARAPLQLPQIESNSARSGRPTLILFLHPHCPCSHATVSELSVIMAHSQDRVNAYVLFMLPPGYRQNWAHTDLWRKASTIPNVISVIDKDARYAR